MSRAGGGFYEWVGTDDGRVPYRISVADEPVFAMAGLWERWRPPDRQGRLGDFAGPTGESDDAGPAGPEVRETFAIVTTEPNDDVAALHDRMPVVLAPGSADRWLHGDEAERSSLLHSYEDKMAVRRVSRTLNDPTNDSPSVLRPARCS